MRETLFILLFFLCLLVTQGAKLSAKNGKNSKGGKAGKPSKKMVAVPRQKGSSGSLPGQSLLKRVFRETKGFFASELEGLTFQLTKPVDKHAPGHAMDVLINCMDMEYESPQFTVSLLAKFSRKLSEVNIYTKIKSLLAIHRMMQYCDSGAKVAVAKCLKSLRKEVDPKIDQNFFDKESIEEASHNAGTVAELEASVLLQEYSHYVFEYTALRGAPSKAKSNAQRAVGFKKLIKLSEKVEACSKTSKSSKITKECIGAVLDDRTWMIKQLDKLDPMVGPWGTDIDEAGTGTETKSEDGDEEVEVDSAEDISRGVDEQEEYEEVKEGEEDYDYDGEYDEVEEYEEVKEGEDEDYDYDGEYDEDNNEEEVHKSIQKSKSKSKSVKTKGKGKSGKKKTK
jgi:hypothetical protein